MTMHITTAQFLAALPESARADVDRAFRQLLAQADMSRDPLGIEIEVYSVGGRSAPAEGLTENEERNVRAALYAAEVSHMPRCDARERNERAKLSVYGGATPRDRNDALRMSR
jgi:hypothetical protein